ncbi:hypothetical protein ACFVZW_06305 [Streptomyces sp. NPDC059567]|uniref:hypothetical protein n=1 Tax=Streptomyces sp. NPDC059567 TaxID=3346867 RepID=UPI0036C9F3F9
MSEKTRSDHEDEWRRQALDAFAQSGGKPAAIPVETMGEGYTHDKGPDGTANSYLGVGSGMTNTTGVVTAVPGPDGKPQVSIDYQVNVWDRYNWDPGKFTPIGPTTAGLRLRAVGVGAGVLAREQLLGHRGLLVRGKVVLPSLHGGGGAQLLPYDHAGKDGPVVAQRDAGYLPLPRLPVRGPGRGRSAGVSRARPDRIRQGCRRAPGGFEVEQAHRVV